MIGLILFFIGVLFLAGALSAGRAAHKESSPAGAVFANLVGILLLIPAALFMLVGFIIMLGGN